MSTSTVNVNEQMPIQVHVQFRSTCCMPGPVPGMGDVKMKDEVVRPTLAHHLGKGENTPNQGQRSKKKGQVRLQSGANFDLSFEGWVWICQMDKGTRDTCHPDGTAFAKARRQVVWEGGVGTAGIRSSRWAGGPARGGRFIHLQKDADAQGLSLVRIRVPTDSMN